MPTQSLKVARSRRGSTIALERPSKVCHAWRLLGKPCLSFTCDDGIFCTAHAHVLDEQNKQR